jgi:hypothetical protein
MKNNWKGALGAALLSVTTFGAGAAYTAAAHAQSIPARYAPARADERGDRNLLSVRRRLENLIGQLQRDPRDYGGHRETAVDLLSKARFELDAAVAYEERGGH